MKTLNRIFSLIILTIMTTTTFADQIDKRQKNQRARIHQGVKSGELTKGEAAKLRHGARHVRRMEHRAKADGHVTQQEAERIEKAQDHLSDKIHEEKHDDETRDN